MRNLKNIYFFLNIEVKLKLRLRFLYAKKKDWLVVIDYKCICFVFNDSEVYDYIIVSGMFLRVFEIVF